MASDKQFIELIGLREARAQMARLPEYLSKAVVGVLRDQVGQMAERARAGAPKRQAGQVPGYAGGMLREHLVGRVSPKNLIGMVGITRGFLMVAKGGAQHRVDKAEKVTYRQRLRSGRLVTRTRMRMGSELARAKLVKAGGRIIEPTMYGHLMEYGTPRTPPRSYLRAAVRAQQPKFEAAMRGLAPDVINALKQIGKLG
jgi:hypothetical protein